MFPKRCPLVCFSKAQHFKKKNLHKSRLSMFSSLQDNQTLETILPIQPSGDGSSFRCSIITPKATKNVALADEKTKILGSKKAFACFRHGIKTSAFASLCNHQTTLNVPTCPNTHGIPLLLGAGRMIDSKVFCRRRKERLSCLSERRAWSGRWGRVGF